MSIRDNIGNEPCGNEENKALSWKEYECAIQKNDMERIEWLYHHHCHWNKQTSLVAYKSGNRDIFCYLIDKGCPYHSWITRYVLEDSDTELLDYLDSRDLLNRFGMLYEACKVDSVLSVEWIRKKEGYYYGDDMCFFFSLRNNSLCIMNWLLDKGVSLPNDSINECVYYLSRLDIISWVYENKAYISLDAWKNAVLHKRLDIIGYFLEKEELPKQVVDFIFELNDDCCFILQLMSMKRPTAFRKEHDRVIKYFSKYNEGGCLFRYISQFFSMDKAYSLLSIQGLRGWLLDDLIKIIFQYV